MARPRLLILDNPAWLIPRARNISIPSTGWAAGKPATLICDPPRRRDHARLLARATLGGVASGRVAVTMNSRVCPAFESDQPAQTAAMCCWSRPGACGRGLRVRAHLIATFRALVVSPNGYTFARDF